MAHVVISTGIVMASVFVDGVTTQMASAFSAGQVAILAVWLTFGSGSLPFRLVIYFLLSTLTVAVGMLAEPSMEMLIVASMQSTFMLFAVTCPLSISWASGWRLSCHFAAKRSGKQWQISTRLLLTLTLLISLLLTLHRLVTSMGFPQDNGKIGYANDRNIIFPMVVVVGAAFLGTSVSVLSAIWSCLAVTACWSRLCATAVVVLVWIAFPFHVGIGSPAHVRWASSTGATVLTVVLSLLFLRRSGVRAVAIPERSIFQ